ncbi:MAG: hypothetical protein IGS50_12260 [Synechococcales cyanobacterium C42_A2020_086]|jgi:hypothetical protein|nr:hypothetical protein [Synechococcales cyanobacterium C42_A2020_086]
MKQVINKQIKKQTDRPTALQPPNPVYAPWSDDAADSREQQIRLKALLLTSAVMTLILTSLPQIGNWFMACPPRPQAHQVQAPMALPATPSDESGETVMVQVSQPANATHITLQVAAASETQSGKSHSEPVESVMQSVGVTLKAAASRSTSRSTTIVVYPAGSQPLNVVIQTQPLR